MDAFLEKALNAALNGGTGAIIALALVWYLARRDSKDASTLPAATQHDCSEVHEAVIELAKSQGRMTEIFERQTSIIEQCAQAHQETRLQLTRVEARLDVRSGPANGRHS